MKKMYGVILFLTMLLTTACASPQAVVVTPTPTTTTSRTPIPTETATPTITPSSTITNTATITNTSTATPTQKPTATVTPHPDHYNTIYFGNYAGWSAIYFRTGTDIVSQEEYGIVYLLNSNTKAFSSQEVFFSDLQDFTPIFIFDDRNIPVWGNWMVYHSESDKFILFIENWQNNFLLFITPQTYEIELIWESGYTNNFSSHFAGMLSLPFYMNKDYIAFTLPRCTHCSYVFPEYSVLIINLNTYDELYLHMAHNSELAYPDIQFDLENGTVIYNTYTHIYADPCEDDFTGCPIPILDQENLTAPLP